MEQDGCEIIVWKEPPAEDGLNARQRRKAAKRAKGLASAKYLEQAAKELRNKRLKQSNRWVDHCMRKKEFQGYQNEIRWGLKTDMAHRTSDEAQYVLERLDRERAAALSRLNRERKAADPGAKDEVWVEDWFGQADVESHATGRDDTRVGFAVGNGAVVEEGEEMDMELDSGDEAEQDAKGTETVDDAGNMSGVEKDGDGL